jgi:hypothetical protein
MFGAARNRRRKVTDGHSLATCPCRGKAIILPGTRTYIEQVLDYNKDPDHDRLVALLQALDCDVELTVRARPA